MWIGLTGQALGQSGITLMLRRRCRQAGLPERLAHPHAFRTCRCRCACRANRGSVSLAVWHLFATR
jgi:hypothetical protein